MRNENNPLLLVICGPFGAGKTALATKLEGRIGLKRCITATTRPARPDEVNGVHYLFFSEEEFQLRVARGEFLEHQLIHGRGLYGVLKVTVERAVEIGERLIMNIDVQGRDALEFHENAFIREAMLTVFLDVPTETLVRRAKSRPGGMAQEELAARLETARQERLHISKFHHVIPNHDGKLDRTAERVIQIVERRLINAER